MRLSYDAWAYRWSNIFQVWDRTFRIILLSGVCGSIRNRLLPATMEARQRSSGRAILVLTLRIYRPARWKFRCAAPRQAQVQPPRRFLDVVWRCRTPEKPRPDSLDRTQPRRPYPDRRQYAVPPGRPEGRSSVRGTLSRDWQFA